ncbi:MAG: DUF4249 domain-containing protein [Tannerella sp.]|jgi:hypothetical protein|nr:DUF4249 domain-containing protein [Tannerella sp.]
MMTGSNWVRHCTAIRRSNLVKNILPVLFILFIGSCSQLIEIKPSNSEPVVVVYGCLTEDFTYQTIRISLSSPYFELEPNQPVSNAIVTIQSMSDRHIFELVETTEKGVYRTANPMSAVVGETYHLSILVDSRPDGNQQLYEATATMQRPFMVDSINIEVRYLMGFKHYALNIYAQEEAGNDYYSAYANINDTLTSNRISRLTVFSDFGIDGQYLDRFPLMQFEDYSNDQFDEINQYFNYVKPGDKITFCISRIEKGYFDFLDQCRSERRGENPFFGGPASNITTNISNGGVGYFAAVSTTRLEAYVP